MGEGDRRRETPTCRGKKARDPTVLGSCEVRTMDKLSENTLTCNTTGRDEKTVFSIVNNIDNNGAMSVVVDLTQFR
jgi:hypothetical protein